MNERYVVKPLVGALHILDTLRFAGSPVPLSDIAKAADLSKTTCFRYLKTMDMLGYVAQHSNAGYTLGPAAYSLSADDTKEVAIRSVADAELRALARRFNETVNLGTAKGKHIHYLAIIEPAKRPLRLRAESGDADLFHSTALGKAILAYLPRDLADLHLKRDLRRLTERTITTRRELDLSLAMVRQFGYAIDREENELGCVCFASPIINSDGRPIAAISMSVPTPRLTPQLDLDIPEAVKASAGKISLDIRQYGLTEAARASMRSKRGSRPA
jgi:DNA-binding IclR family transcriptional regulator